MFNKYAYIFPIYIYNQEVLSNVRKMDSGFLKSRHNITY